MVNKSDQIVNKVNQNRIQYALDNCGKSREVVAKECKVGRTTVQGWRQRGTIPSESLSAFSQSTGFAIQWIVEGTGPQRRDAGEHPVPVLRLDEVSNFALSGTIALEDRDYIEASPMYAGRRLCAVQIADNTMENELNIGETAIIDVDSKTKTGQNGVFLIRKTGETVIRKFIDTGTSTILMPFNERYPNILITDENPCDNLGAILYKVKIYS